MTGEQVATLIDAMLEEVHDSAVIGSAAGGGVRTGRQLTFVNVTSVSATPSTTTDWETAPP